MQSSIIEVKPRGALAWYARLRSLCTALAGWSGKVHLAWINKLAFRKGGDGATSMIQIVIKALADSPGAVPRGSRARCAAHQSFPKGDEENSRDPTMKKLNTYLKMTVLRKILPWSAKERYRPEKYYMRGPGPKAKAKDCDGPSGDCQSPFGMPVADRRSR